MITQASLSEFPLVPAPGKVTITEYGTQLISVPSTPEDPADARDFLDKILDYHRIDGSNIKPVFAHKIPSIKTTDFRHSLILQKDEGIIKGIWDSSRELGWRGVEEYLRKVQRNSVTNVLFGILSTLGYVTDTVQKLKYETAVLFFPHLGMSPKEIIQTAAQVRNWHKSWVKAMLWHPNFPKLALALQDDSVRICTIGQEVMPMLRCANQKNICSIAWRPYSGAELALGVDTGIVVWHLDSPASIKPGGCQTKFYSVKNHAPVTSIEYSSSGLLLLSSCSFDASIYIWDTSSWQKTPLRRLGGGGVPLALWSPCADKILTTSPSCLFRIWDREKYWNPRRWTTPKESIESACWSPDSSSLLFASGGTIFSLHFALNDIDRFINVHNEWVAVPLYDVSETTALCEDQKLEYKVGGRVRRLELDPSGSRLAVLFDDSELVALFRVQPRSVYYLAPCGFIRGFPNECPVAIGFQKDFQDGALLTIAWNSGRLQYLPILFAQSSGIKNLIHQDHYKIPSVVQNLRNSVSFTDPNSCNKSSNKYSSFRTSSFVDSYPPETREYEYTTASADPPRLFSQTPKSNF